MKTEKAIQVLRDFNLWRRGEDENVEQPDQYTIGEAIDDVLMAIDNMEMEAELYRGTINGWEDKWKCAVELAANARAELDEERKEGEEQARLLGMGSEREVDLLAKNRNLERALEKAKVDNDWIGEKLDKAEAERDLWREEAQRWREQALDLETQIETAIKRVQWRQDNLDRGIKELKGDY